MWHQINLFWISGLQLIIIGANSSFQSPKLKFSNTYYTYITYSILKMLNTFLYVGQKQLMIKLTASERLTWQFLPVQTSHWIKTCLLIVLMFFCCCYTLSLSLAQAATQIMFVLRHNRNFISNCCTYLFQTLQVFYYIIYWLHPTWVHHWQKRSSFPNILQAAKNVLCFILICFLSQTP